MATYNAAHNKQPNAAEEIALLRQEFHELRHELLNAVRYLATSMKQQTNVTHPINTRQCHVCGGPLSHHPAQTGELVLCAACGWSEFVSRDGHEYCEVQPDPVPPTATTPPWAA